MTSVAIKLASPEAIRAACELSIAQGEQSAQVMYKSEHFEDDDYVGADLEEFANAKDDPDEFAEFCGGGRHSWELWVYETAETPARSVSAGLPPDPEGMNDKRAGWAATALKAFQDETGADDEDALGDLLGDLMHWCDRHNFDFEAALERARGHYEAETAGEVA